MAPIVTGLEADDRFEAITVLTAQHREMLDQVVELYALHVSTFRNAAFAEAMLVRHAANPLIHTLDVEELRGLIEATIKAGF